MDNLKITMSKFAYSSLNDHSIGRRRIYYCTHPRIALFVDNILEPRTSRAEANCSDVTFLVLSGSKPARISSIRVSLTTRCSWRTINGSRRACGSTACLPMSSGVLPDRMTAPCTASKSGRFLRISSMIARNSYSTGISWYKMDEVHIIITACTLLKDLREHPHVKLLRYLTYAHIISWRHPSVRDDHG